MKTWISRRRLLAGSALALAAVGLTCQPVRAADWKDVVEAAKKEGSVTLYSSQGLDQLNDLAGRFKKQYGITLQVVRGVDSDLLPKVEAEFSTGRGIGDMLITADLNTVKERNAKGFDLAPVGPSFNNPVYDRKTRVPEGTYFESNAFVSAFSWNKELYAKGIKDYPDMLDPALGNGKIGITIATTQALVDFYMYLEEMYGADFVTKLAAQKPRIYAGALPAGQAVISGEIAVASYGQPMIDAQAKGAPVGWGLPPKSWGARFWGQILKTGPHPNAAQVLADFIVTQDGQEAVARMNASALPNINGAIADTSKVRAQDLSKLSADKVAAYQERWRSLFLNK